MGPNLNNKKIILFLINLYLPLNELLNGISIKKIFFYNLTLTTGFAVGQHLNKKKIN
jgi:hypothetical protein